MDAQLNETTQPRIVVGVDGSEPSLKALREAAELAPALGARVEAIGAWEFPALTADPYFAPTQWSPERDAQQLMEQSIATVFGETVPSWFSATITRGPAARVLIEESRGARMLILGSRGHGGFVGLMLGSVSTACVHHAECPVLITRDFNGETDDE